MNRSLRDPAGHVGSVLASTVAVYAAACDVGATRIVTASSGGTYYGDAEVLPTPEGAPPTPRSPYGAEKVSEEVYLAMFGRLHGISTMALRYGNVYGPRQDGTGEAGVVAITCRRLAAGQRPVMYGDGGQSRDFVYVGDVVAANVAALASDRSGAVNVGTGDDETILGVMRVLCELHGASPDMEKAPARVGEVRRICLDPRRATEWLEWRPATSRQDGLASTVRYFSGTG